jgi:hypothetical protein
LLSTAAATASASALTGCFGEVAASAKQNNHTAKQPHHEGPSFGTGKYGFLCADVFVIFVIWTSVVGCFILPFKQRHSDQLVAHAQEVQKEKSTRQF